MGDAIAVQRCRHLFRPVEFSPVDTMFIARELWQQLIALGAFKRGIAGLTYLGLFPFAHTLAARQVVPGVAEDEIVDQVYAQKNAAQSKGRTHQEIHGSTPNDGCIGVSITQSMPRTLIANRCVAGSGELAGAAVRASEFRYLG
jgi:hypothetical protein